MSIRGSSADTSEEAQKKRRRRRRPARTPRGLDWTWDDGREPTLRDAVIQGLHPCEQCHPVDYRPIVTDGGHDVRSPGPDLAAHEYANDLEAALDHVMATARVAAQTDESVSVLEESLSSSE